MLMNFVLETIICVVVMWGRDSIISHKKLLNYYKMYVRS